VLPKKIENWSLTGLQQRLEKTGGRLIKHARYYWLLLAEGRLTRRVFAAILRRIWALPLPAGVRAGGLPWRKSDEGKKEGWWSVRELRRNAPKLPVGSRLEGASPTSYGYCYGFRRRPAKNLVGIEAIAVYYREPEVKMEIPVETARRCSGAQ
jgi:hypothetical protein